MQRDFGDLYGAPRPPERADLVSALDAGTLRLLFQPIVELATRQPVGAEALLRWPYAGDVLAPPAFWHLVDTPLARRIGGYVLDRACAQVARWRAEGGCRAVSINVDPRELGRAWVDGVGSALDRHGVPATALTLELTETARIGGERAAACVAELRRIGVGVALDDTGTGYNALTAVTEVPLTELKIDRGFVARLGDPRNDTVVRALIHVARELEQRIVAEGVETEAQASRLQSFGVEFAQGYLFSAPVPAAELDTFWRRHDAAHGGALATMVRLSESGASPATIAAMLNRQGSFAPNGRRWHPASVARILGGIPGLRHSAGGGPGQGRHA